MARLKTMPPGRRCSMCNAFLSIYNKGDNCENHNSKEESRMVFMLFESGPELVNHSAYKKQDINKS